MLCMSCNPVQDIPEDGYLQHQKIVHGNAPQAQVIQPSVTGKLPVDPEFEKTLKDIEEFERQKKLEQAQKPQEQATLNVQNAVPVVEKPIELTYVYTGTNNGHQVQTLELDVDGKHFVIAFDPIEKKQVESREVADLNKKEDITKQYLRPKLISSLHESDFINENGDVQHLGHENVIQCDLCNKPFTTKRALSMHKMRVHK